MNSGNPDRADVVVLAFYTGMRRSEILGLTWARVDQATATILVEQSKNGQRRSIPFGPRVGSVLARRGPGTGHVFPRRRWDSYRSAWESAVRRAGIDDFRFHDARHTFASWAVQRGSSLQEVQKLLGHKTLAMTLRYGHLAPEQLRQAVARVDRDTTAAPAADVSTVVARLR
jgi:integrase